MSTVDNNNKVSDLASLPISEVCAKLGERLKAERLRKDWTQAEIAIAASISLRTYKRLEAAGHGSIETLVAVLAALGRVRVLDIALPHPALQRRDTVKELGRHVRERASRRHKSATGDDSLG